MQNFRPLKAPNDIPITNPKYWDYVTYDCYGSPKIDGIRAAVINKTVRSSSNTQLPNKFVQQHFSEYEGLDGELTVGDPNVYNVFNLTTSCVQSFEKPGNLYFHVFDCVLPEISVLPYEERYAYLEDRIKRLDHPRLKLVEHKLLMSKEEVLEFDRQNCLLGYEGTMLNNPKAAYKFGRASLLENIIFKLKQFEEDEATILDIEEGISNQNEKTIDAQGLTKRSTAKAGLVPSGTLGRFICDFNGMPLKVGPGVFTKKERQFIFDHKETFINKLLKFRHMKYGQKNSPRLPIATGFRETWDLGK